MTTHQEDEVRDVQVESNLAQVKNTILIMSGKGGVGKTTVSVNLAFALVRDGFRVGILDVDIHGPNIAKMLGIEEARVSVFDKRIEPVEVVPDLHAVSMALLGHDSDRPIIWRGPMKMGAIKQLLSEVNWGELDYLIIDAPPGTGDEPLSICQLVPEMSGAIIVTTPQDVATLDSRKGIGFTREVNVPLIGIIENMSGFCCPHCDKDIELFGSGGGKKVSESFGVPFLGALPLEAGLVALSDQGKPFVQHVQESGVSQAMNAIVEKVVAFTEKKGMSV